MYQNSLLISHEKQRKLNKFIKVMLCVSLICLNIIHKRNRNKLYINWTMFESLNWPTVWIIISTWKTTNQNPNFAGVSQSLSKPPQRIAGSGFEIAKFCLILDEFLAPWAFCLHGWRSAKITLGSDGHMTHIISGCFASSFPGPLGRTRPS
jgi:hypothetical protein